MGCDDVGSVTSVPTDPLATGTVIEPVLGEFLTRSSS
jgi:hypothetical protein